MIRDRLIVRLASMFPSSQALKAATKVKYEEYRSTKLEARRQTRECE